MLVGGAIALALVGYALFCLWRSYEDPVRDDWGEGP
jgi:hypothetical protein